MWPMILSTILAASAGTVGRARDDARLLIDTIESLQRR